MSGVTGQFYKLSKISAALRKMPITAAQKTAEKVAPVVTEMARTAFEAGESVYGGPRAGSPVALIESGRLLDTVRFVNIGRIVRCVLGTPYARYHIWRGILPRGGDPLPFKWLKAIRDISREVHSEEVSRAA